MVGGAVVRDGAYWLIRACDIDDLDEDGQSVYAYAHVGIGVALHEQLLAGLGTNRRCAAWSHAIFFGPTG